jgi:hypothetical protein
MQQQNALATHSVIAAIEKRRLKRKQARPSESTWLPGARCRLAQSAIAPELKPLTAVILA